MELHIAGGCGDEGRNCFFIKGKVSFLFDAGTSTDGKNRMPDLTREEIRSAKYVLLSHSHRDHSGAIPWLYKNGFTGAVVASEATYYQLHDKPEDYWPLPAAHGRVELPDGFTITWGRTGHCAGSVWYAIRREGRYLVYSGDYRSGDPCYAVDPLQEISADMAILDGSYNIDTDGAAMRENVWERGQALLSKGSLVLPVPHHGRGLSMAVMFYQWFGEKYPIYFSHSLWKEWKKLRTVPGILSNSALSIPEDAFQDWDETSIGKTGLYFLTDAQLAKDKSKALLDAYPDVPVLLTGHVHGYGKAQSFVDSGRAMTCLWPNHMTVKEAKEIIAGSDLKKVVLFHNKHLPARSDRIKF